jgi:transposase
VESCLREVDFLDSEVRLIERELAAQGLCSPEIHRLMSVPGVSLVSAAAFVAAVGDIHRFSSPKKLVSYVGLDPRVRLSGEAPARHGRISKLGSAEARHMLCEAAWIAVRTPGPLRAFYERLRARRGAQIALVATGRKLGVLFWHLLTREEDYAFARPCSAGTSCAGSSSWPAIRPAAASARAPRRANASSTTSANCPNRWNTPTAASSPTGSPNRREAVRARHRGAHFQVIFLAKRQQRGRQQPQNLRFSSSSPAPAATLPERSEIVRTP